MTTTSTTVKQRIGIWIIAALMVLGTIGSLTAALLANENSSKDVKDLNESMAAYNKAVEENAKVLSKKYYSTLLPYKEYVQPFDDNVTELETEDLKVGTGEEVGKNTTIFTYYIGWNPEGEMFDSSFDGDELMAPFEFGPDESVIEGWKKGVIGMKVGGVRMLTIPSDLAYGEAGSGDMIKGNMPIRFIIFAIPDKNPEIPEELLELYQRVEG